MQSKLIELSTKELLNKFGVGDHKPGSGSAAALHGLLSAQLIRTVATISSRKNNLKDKHENFASILQSINTDLYPRLEELFHRDSAQFDEVFKARVSRDKADKYSTEWHDLSNKALENLRTATQLPLDIASICLVLARYSLTIFDDGYRAVRGDSGVALHGALCAIGGCLSIIDLNLTSFSGGSWVQNVREQTERLRTEYQQLLSQAGTRLESLKAEAINKVPFQLDIDSLRSGTWKGRLINESEIEKIAYDLQASIWRNRYRIWGDDPPTDPVEMLNPEIVTKLLGYSFNEHTTLGQNELSGTLIEVAGYIDNDEQSINISRQFPLETRNFTAAHELGHSLLHKQNHLHRDRPLDGPDENQGRDLTERQADKFASFYLMPKKLLKTRFANVFLSEYFEITEETAFALGMGSSASLTSKAGDRRGLARILASADFFNGSAVVPLFKQFKVSVEAMAIRLEELGLVNFGRVR